MEQNHKKTMSHERKVLTISLFIYILAVLFAIVVSWIIGPDAKAVSIPNDTIHINSNSNGLFTKIPLTSCQQASKSYEIEVITPEFPNEMSFRDAVDRVAFQYSDVSSELIRSIIWHESRFQPNVHNGRCVGLMQVSTKWHANRAIKLGVTNFYDPYSNILIGVDYLNEILSNCGDIGLALMIYNGDSRAYDLYSNGLLSEYADGILSMTNYLKGG